MKAKIGFVRPLENKNKKEEKMSMANRIPIGKVLNVAVIMAILALVSIACAIESNPQGVQSPPTVVQPGQQAQQLSTPVPGQVSLPPQCRANIAPTDIRATHPAGIEYLDPVPMTKVVKATKGPVQTTNGQVMKPIITWGADEADIYGNGGRTTQPGSIFAGEGLNIVLCREDNFARQVEKYIAGETPYLRGTKGMISAAAEVARERGVEFAEFYSKSTSTGGDVLVVRGDSIKKLEDLCGKYVGAQLYGPHMEYIHRLSIDAKCPGGIKVKWLRELSDAPYETSVIVNPRDAFQVDESLSGVTVISPDADALTAPHPNCGRDPNVPPCDVGGGQEGSVRYAKALISTKTGTGIIYDVDVVNAKYLEANREQVQKLTHGMMVATEAQMDLFSQKDTRQTEYQNFLAMAAEIVLDNRQRTAEVEGLYADMTFAKYPGNVKFYSGQGTTRTFEVLTKETQDALMVYGLMSGPVPIEHARWDYAALAVGIKDTAGVTVPKFDEGKVSDVIVERRRQGTVEEGFVFPPYPIYFDPDETDFAVQRYLEEFRQTVEYMETYSGAIGYLEAYSDPTNYNELKASGAPQQILIGTLQKLSDTAAQRGEAARDGIIAYAASQGIELRESQFYVEAKGINGVPHPDVTRSDADRTKRQENRVVTFKIFVIEGEYDESK